MSEHVHLQDNVLTDFNGMEEVQGFAELCVPVWLFKISKWINQNAVQNNVLNAVQTMSDTSTPTGNVLTEFNGMQEVQGFAIGPSCITVQNFKIIDQNAVNSSLLSSNGQDIFSPSLRIVWNVVHCVSYYCRALIFCTEWNTFEVSPPYGWGWGWAPLSTKELLIPP